MSFSRIARSTQVGIRAKRIPLLSEDLHVEAKTIGTILALKLGTENLSRTGLLLNGGRNAKIPYQVNTLLELTVDPNSTLLERPVSCLAKVVRLDKATDEAQSLPLFGVKIVQMENRDVEVWDRAVTALESWSGTLPP